MPGKHQIVYIGRVADVVENTLVVFTIESPSSRDLIGRVVVELASSTSSSHRVAVAVIESQSSRD